MVCICFVLFLYGYSLPDLLLYIAAFAMLVGQGLRPVIGTCPDDVKQLIESCWDKDPSKRPGLFFAFCSVELSFMHSCIV